MKSPIDKFFEYLTFEKRYSNHTVISYRNDIEQFHAYLISAYDLEDLVKVKHTHIRSWLVELSEAGIGSRSINRKLSSLRSLFKYFQKIALVDHSPLQKIISPKNPKRLPTYLPKEVIEEVYQLIEPEESFSVIRDKLIFSLLYQTGMRRAELIQLSMKDVDSGNMEIKVFGKGGKERIIPITKHLAKEIDHYIITRNEHFDSGLDNLFLTDKGKVLYPKYVYNCIKQLLSRATTIKKRSPHVLRHSFATHLTDKGADLNAIKSLLGHANLSATQIYTHNSIKRLQDIYKKAHPSVEKP